jgi:hypothetical protein
VAARQWLIGTGSGSLTPGWQWLLDTLAVAAVDTVAVAQWHLRVRAGFINAPQCCHDRKAGHQNSLAGQKCHYRQNLRWKMGQNRAKMTQKCAKMIENGPGMGQNGPKMGQNDGKMMENGSKMGQNDGKMMENGPKWVKMGKKWVKITQNDT